MKQVLRVIVFATFAAITCPLNADVLITSARGDGAIIFNDTVGYSFMVGSSPLAVTHLGVWDAFNDGLAQSNQVGLWDTSGTLLGLTSVPAGTSAPLLNEFRYSMLLAPVSLLANTAYVVGALAGAGENRTTGVPAPTFSMDASLLGTSRNNSPGNFSFPNASGSFPGQAIVGPNIQYVVVPEPSHAGLLLAGLAFLLPRKIR